MRFYLIHTIVKDFSVMFLYFVLSGSIGQVALDNVLAIMLISLRMMSGFIAINLILQTAIYLGLTHYVRWRKWQQKFIFGLVLHIPTMLFWIFAIGKGNSFDCLIAILLSSFVSGTLYVVLNSRLSSLKRKSELQES
jgi:hypothetical protein